MAKSVDSASLLRLDAMLRTAGIVFDGVEGGPEPATVIVTPKEAQKAAQPIIDAFDWSEQGQATYDATQAKAQAKAIIDDPTNPHAIALRALIQTSGLTAAQVKANI